MTTISLDNPHIAQAIADGFSQVQTFGGWMPLVEWCKPRDPSQPKLQIVEYSREHATLYGPWGDSILRPGTKERFNWPLS